MREWTEEKLLEVTKCCERISKFFDNFTKRKDCPSRVNSVKEWEKIIYDINDKSNDNCLGTCYEVRDAFEFWQTLVNDALLAGYRLKYNLLTHDDMKSMPVFVDDFCEFVKRAGNGFEDLSDKFDYKESFFILKMLIERITRFTEYAMCTEKAIKQWKDSIVIIIEGKK